MADLKAAVDFAEMKKLSNQNVKEQVGNFIQFFLNECIENSACLHSYFRKGQCKASHLLKSMFTYTFLRLIPSLRACQHLRTMSQ